MKTTLVKPPVVCRVGHDRAGVGGQEGGQGAETSRILSLPLKDVSSGGELKWRGSDSEKARLKPASQALGVLHPSLCPV